MHRNPWKTLHRRLVYENPFLRLEEHRVVNPGGGRNDYGLIRFANHAIGVVPIDAAGNTWLVGQWRYALDTYSWEIPMGGHPAGEDPLEGARRELREETGLTAATWTELMRLHTSNSVTDELGIVYVARDLTEGDPEFEETEAITIRKLPLEEAVGRALAGEITDAISVAALLRLAHAGPA